MQQYEASGAFAQQMDAADALATFRSRFHFPNHNGSTAIYLCGNSLGLQPVTARKYINDELDAWATLGVEGHFNGRHPWTKYHNLTKPALAHVFGAKESEVVAMNLLTPNLHFMLVSFYRPEGKRNKVLMEAGAFPSDQYALETHVRHHGLDPDAHIIEVAPREGEHCLRTEDILQAIEEHGPELALVMFSGIQYYTGQFFDLQAITVAGHKAGARVGFDLAHAGGNVPLQMHNWGPDFAVWCSYKYLNSGPGNVSGVFVHERHHHDNSLHRFAGWWGHNEEERFLMEKGFKPMTGANGWQQANANILSTAAHRASLDLFLEAKMPALREKSLKLTGYLEYLIRDISGDKGVFEIITPTNPEERGCQLSIFIHHRGKELFEYLSRQGVIADWREPNVIRLAPTPMYNSFTDVYRFSHILRKGIEELS